MLNESDQWGANDKSGVYESDAVSNNSAIDNQEINPKKLRSFYQEFTQSVDKNKKVYEDPNGFTGEFVNLQDIMIDLHLMCTKSCRHQHEREAGVLCSTLK